MSICGDSVQLTEREREREKGKAVGGTLKLLSQLINNFVMAARWRFCLRQLEC